MSYSESFTASGSQGFKIGMFEQFKADIRNAQEVYNSAEQVDLGIKVAVYGIVAGKAIAAIALLGAAAVGAAILASAIVGALVYLAPALVGLALVAMAMSALSSYSLAASNAEDLTDESKEKKKGSNITNGIDWNEYANNFIASLSKGTIAANKEHDNV